LLEEFPQQVFGRPLVTIFEVVEHA